jgi:hypothetical protein
VESERDEEDENLNDEQNDSVSKTMNINKCVPLGENENKLE